jgi:DNA repair protein RecN (Recombination protein N)
VGQKLQNLSQTHQVLCITHLPQIAAFAETHFKVIKETRNNRTQTQIRPLQKEDRVEEMARMLEGATATSKTQSVARDMLRRAKKNQDAD